MFTWKIMRKYQPISHRLGKKDLAANIRDLDSKFLYSNFSRNSMYGP